MDPETAKRLGKKGVHEYWKLQQHLMTQLDTHSILHGDDFWTRCQIMDSDGEFSIWCEDAPINGIVSVRRDVIQALFNGASSQLGR